MIATLSATGDDKFAEVLGGRCSLRAGYLYELVDCGDVSIGVTQDIQCESRLTLGFQEGSAVRRSARGVLGVFGASRGRTGLGNIEFILLIDLGTDVRAASLRRSWGALSRGAGAVVV
jgi:hypothetical protein